jgi:hypothetical protein
VNWIKFAAARPTWKSSITSDCRGNHGQSQKRSPGEVLLEEFIVPMNLSQNAVAQATDRCH